MGQLALHIINHLNEIGQSGGGDISSTYQERWSPIVYATDGSWSSVATAQPANSVVVITAVFNSNNGVRDIGVREVGSTNSRIVTIQKGAFSFTGKTDGSGNIELYQSSGNALDWYIEAKL
jgi:hypothetical protein